MTLIDPSASAAGDTPPPISFSETLRESMACGLLLVNSRNQVVVLNPDAEKLLRVKAAHVLNRPCHSLPAPFPDLLQEILESGKSIQNRALFVKSSSGLARELCVSGSAVSVNPDEPPCAVLNFWDLTGPRALEERLRRLDRLVNLGTTSVMTAHEAKNALVPIKTFVELLRRENPQAELAAVAEAEVRRLEALVNRMLAFANPPRVPTRTVHIRPLLELCLRLFQRQIQDQNVQVETTWHTDVDEVSADPHQLEQVFVNVLLNALEAMAPGGTLRLHTSLRAPEPQSGSGYVLEILFTDSGVGIEPEHMDRLFETFFTTKSQGTGLGLAISRRILREYHGDIEIESQPHRGTRVKILLPAAAPPPSDGAGP